MAISKIPATRLGRIIGALLILQLAGLSAPFIIMNPVISTSFLETAAPAGFVIKLAVVLLLAGGFLAVGIAIAVFPLFRQFGPAIAFTLIAAALAWLIIQAVDNAHLLSMLALSEAYVGGGETVAAEASRAAGAALRSTRRFVHFAVLLAVDAWFFAFYASLFRSSLIPRGLSAFALLAVLLHVAGITVPLMLGLSAFMPLGFALAVSHVLIGGWLIFKGFDQGSELN